MVRWLAAVGARVVWRSEGRHAERPGTLEWGGESLPLAVLERRIEGPQVAGGSLKRVFVVSDTNGRTLRITRAEGEVMVEVRLDR
jgi:hypothetical protein